MIPVKRILYKTTVSFFMKHDEQTTEESAVLFKGFDTPYSVYNKAHPIQAAGYNFVIRYISPDSANFPNKRLKTEEVQGLHTMKVAVGFVWEQGNSASTFNAANGKLHAQQAVAVLKSLGVPSNVANPTIAIYLAVDVDVPAAGGVTEYFTAAHPVVKAAGYLVGVYGSGEVCGVLKSKGLSHYSWLAQSTGWSESKGFTAWDVLQGPSTTAVGLDVDADSAKSLVSFWSA
jgi:hypothetical protein